MILYQMLPAILPGAGLVDPHLQFFRFYLLCALISLKVTSAVILSPVPNLKFTPEIMVADRGLSINILLLKMDSPPVLSIFSV